MRPDASARRHDGVGDLPLHIGRQRQVVIVHRHSGEAVAERCRHFVPACRRGARRRHFLAVDEVGIEGQRLDAFRRRKHRLEFVIDEMPVAAESGQQSLEVVGRPVAGAAHQRCAPHALGRIGEERSDSGEVIPCGRRREVLAGLLLVGLLIGWIVEQVLAIGESQHIGLHRQAVDLEPGGLDRGGIDAVDLVKMQRAVVALVDCGVEEDFRDKILDVEAFGILRIEDHIRDRRDLVGERRHPRRIDDHDVVVRTLRSEFGEGFLL